MENIVGWVTCVRVDREHKVCIPVTCLSRNTRQTTVILLCIGDTRHLGLETEITQDCIQAKTFIQVGHTLPETLLTSVLTRLIQVAITDILKDWIEIHQAVVRAISTVTRVDVDLVISRISGRGTLSLALHIVEQCTIQFLYQAGHLLTNRLFCQIKLKHTYLTVLGIIDNTT